jgi:beta-glucosidase
MVAHPPTRSAISITSWVPLLALLFASLVPMTTGQAQELPQLGADPIADIVAAMTVEEKIAVLIGMGFHMDIPFLPPMDSADAAVPEKVPGAAGRTHAIDRLGVPSLTLADGPAGVRIDPEREDAPGQWFHATAFPVATLLASSWDTALVREVGRAFGEEVREYGVDILLAPGMNIHRNPLGGRNFEYYSEDPVLTGWMASAFVTGVQSEGVGTSLKHFAANNQEFNRMRSNTIVSERALREIYLRGFEIAVRHAQPWTVMSAYNLINGAYAPENRELLVSILRDEWGFEGFVMTDWFGGQDAVATVQAGNDVIMPGYLQQKADLLDAAATGMLTEDQLNESVTRVLRIVEQSPTFKGYAYSNAPDFAAHAAIARRAAAESMVLLKNDDQALPLPASGSIALFGNAGYDLVVGGTGSGEVNEAYVVSLDAGLVEAGHPVHSTLAQTYRGYIDEEKAKRPKPAIAFFPPPPIPEMPVDAEMIASAADETDVAIVTVGRQSGEMTDRKVEWDFLLTETEHALLRDVSAAFHAAGKRVIVVMNVAGVIEVGSWRDHADAILLAWQPGQEGGHAIADVLRGVVNPSGRLPMTFPLAYEDVPSAGNFPGKVLQGQSGEGGGIIGVPTEVTYDEGVYVGYRYYNTFGVEPAYPFGYGLSYSTFGWDDLNLSSAELDDEITVTAVITNTGPVPGREVVQLYVAAPGDALDKPESELRAFAKTSVIEPGQSETVTFTLTAADLASFHTDRAAWVAEAGTYTVKLGASALDIRGNATFELPNDVVVQQVRNVVVPEVLIEELTPPHR